MRGEQADLPTVYYMVATHPVYNPPSEGEWVKTRKKGMQTLDYSVANILCDAYPYFSHHIGDYDGEIEMHFERKRAEGKGMSWPLASARLPLCELRKREAWQLKHFKEKVTCKVVVNPAYRLGENGVEEFHMPHFDGYMSRGDYVNLTHVRKMLNQSSVIYPCLNEYRINQIISGETPVIQYQ